MKASALLAPAAAITPRNSRSLNCHFRKCIFLVAKKYKVCSKYCQDWLDYWGFFLCLLHLRKLYYIWGFKSVCFIFAFPSGERWIWLLYTSFLFILTGENNLKSQEALLLRKINNEALSISASPAERWCLITSKPIKRIFKLILLLSKKANTELVFSAS